MVESLGTCVLKELWDQNIQCHPRKLMSLTVNRAEHEKADSFKGQ